MFPNTPPAPYNKTMLDGIIEDALNKAKREAVEAIFRDAHIDGDSAIRQTLQKQVIDYLNSPEGRVKVIALADKAIEKLLEVARHRY